MCDLAFPLSSMPDKIWVALIKTLSVGFLTYVENGCVDLNTVNFQCWGWWEYLHREHFSCDVFVRGERRRWSQQNRENRVLGNLRMTPWMSNFALDWWLMVLFRPVFKMTEGNITDIYFPHFIDLHSCTDISVCASWILWLSANEKKNNFGRKLILIDLI